MTWAGAPTWAGAVGVYLLLGAVVGLLLLRAGQPRATALAAVAAWPLLVGLVSARREQVPRLGPLAADIAQAFAGLEALLAQQRVEGQGVPWGGELGALRRALESADARLAVADGIMADLGSSASELAAVAGDLSALRAARERAHGELRAVLGGVHRLRIQVGLLALSEIHGEAAQAVQQHLRELNARARALDELSVLGVSMSTPLEPKSL